MVTYHDSTPQASGIILGLDWVDSAFHPFNGSIKGENDNIKKIGNVIEEVVDLARQINLEVDRDDVQELLGFHDQELAMDEQEQVIEKLESLDPFSQKIE
ncbi:hypothetical protein TNCV_504401 [Trichonephila clavipes]|nr:hypothetical protein TNCV_504401 [Trichonephila clavipes]